VTSTDPVGKLEDKGQSHESSTRSLPADRAQYSYVRALIFDDFNKLDFLCFSRVLFYDFIEGDK